MKKPRMVVFDYGNTLIAELGYNSFRGAEAVMRRVTANPLGLTVEQVHSFTDDLYAELSAKVKTAGIELSNIGFQRLAYEYLRLEFSLSGEELERVWWDGCSPGAYMPHVREMLAYLRENGFRAGIISNASISGASMKARIETFFPEHPFEFIMSSCDYILRKPSRMLFELALRKADLPADEVWFCGDSILADIPGAASAGIFPVWYDDITMPNPFRPPAGVTSEEARLRIYDWLELIDILRKL
ncbi:MAG: HAD family hydrolase [Oscillospiraceae bacterium]|nr:HAD family hydrolase [Oscillospiraceae bacterium]